LNKMYTINKLIAESDNCNDRNIGRNVYVKYVLSRVEERIEILAGKEREWADNISTRLKLTLSDTMRKIGFDVNEYDEFFVGKLERTPVSILRRIAKVYSLVPSNVSVTRQKSTSLTCTHTMGNVFVPHLKHPRGNTYFNPVGHSHDVLRQELLNHHDLRDIWKDDFSNVEYHEYALGTEISLDISINDASTGAPIYLEMTSDTPVNGRISFGKTYDPVFLYRTGRTREWI